jgi:hypothetical protein
MIIDDDNSSQYQVRSAWKDYLGYDRNGLSDERAS